MASPSRLRTPAQKVWNVEAVSSRTLGPRRASRRDCISFAALLVKVTAVGADADGADEVGDAVGDDAGFAGAGAGDNKERAFDVFDGFPLGGVESF